MMVSVRRVRSQTNSGCNALNRYPLAIMPMRHTPTNVASKRGKTCRESMVSEGMESTVTLIMNASSVPSPTPFAYNASAMGSVPNGVHGRAHERGEHHGEGVAVAEDRLDDRLGGSSCG